MAIYDYKCYNCKSVTEVIKSIKDCDREELCPKCHEFMTKEISRGTNFVLKGKGWFNQTYNGKKEH